MNMREGLSASMYAVPYLNPGFNHSMHGFLPIMQMQYPPMKQAPDGGPFYQIPQQQQTFPVMHVFPEENNDRTFLDLLYRFILLYLCFPYDVIVLLRAFEVQMRFLTCYERFYYHFCSSYKFCFNFLHFFVQIYFYNFFGQIYLYDFLCKFLRFFGHFSDV